MKHALRIGWFALLVSSTSMVAQTDVSYSEPINRISFPDPINFNGNEYFLAKSNQNSATWVQQQYVMHDDNVEDYKELINISYFDKAIDLDMAVDQKLEFLQKKQQNTNDKYYTVQITESPDGKEVIVDYMMSFPATDTEEAFVEYNIDRFKTLDSGNKKAFIIFTFSKRLVGDPKYGSKSLSKERSKLMEQMITTQIPAISYKPTEIDKKK